MPPHRQSRTVKRNAKYISHQQRSMALTDLACRTAKAKDKPYKLADERSLYLLVTAAGGRPRRIDYRVEGERKTLGRAT